MKIVADDKIPFLKGALEPYAEMIYLPGKQIDREIIKDADAMLIRTRTKCNEELLEGTKIQFIGSATIGFDHIDTQYCNNSKIFWTNAPGCNSSSVQQYIAAALLKIASYSNFCVKDKTLGIVGVGNVGSKVEKFARTIGMNVLLNDPPRERFEGKKKFHTLSTVISESDIVSIHVPLNLAGEDFTFHLFDEEKFQRMKEGSWFLNTSRGEVVDTAALKKNLNSGKPVGAIIDVWENEPDIDPDLMSRIFIATPHIAGYSADGKANGTAMVVNSLSKYFNLPVKNWYPEKIPPPASPGILLDCKGKSEEELLSEAVNHTYNIDEDNARLRNSPSDFEKLRGNYPLRREFTSYTIDLKGATEEVKDIIKNIGFKVKD